MLASLASGDATAATGGPDAYGWYTFADQADGAVYNYVDITATGAMVVSGAEATASVPMPAPFYFYGHTLSDIVVNTNGFITTDIGSEFDASNDCGLPVPPSTGEGFRIYALHDDLLADVYYQYFDEIAAAAVGFPGETAGISVFQWVGNHDGGGGAIDVEAVLFHDDFSVLTMVAADSEAGSGSTLGIQDDVAAAGLTYQCNVAGAVIPGATAVEYTLGPDSDCCAASADGVAGCQNIACQNTVCALDGFCCSTQWDGVCAGGAAADCAILCGAPPPAITINEIRIDQPGGDIDEYVELVGPPGASLDGLQYVVLGDVPTAELEEIIDLTGQVIPMDGIFVIAEAGFTLNPPADLVVALTLDNLDTNTHMLVANVSAAELSNLDGNADGLLDFQPWDGVLDTVAIVAPADAELPYGPINPTGGAAQCMAGPTCQQVEDGIDAPMHVYRCADGDGTFLIGNDDPAAIPATDSPGAANLCAVCGDGVAELSEECDGDGMGVGGETAACDDDCTFAACGDGTVNMTAGEDCDDVGETAVCDVDCTLAMCGDGILNLMAGEVCDGDGMGVGGETATCDDDCTPPMCGDGVTNMAAGEDCDDMGESATCNADCTAAVCGDGQINPTAGETCDDGGRSDMCDDDCTAVSCGDGILNMTAGEECDGDGMGVGGETDTCDDDCTNAMCGDMQVNATAGEECDEGGETETCDDDCTAPACGDGTVNATAGEECDDGNNDDGDGCSADCIEELGGSTGGSTGADETAGPADSSGGGEGATSMGPTTVTATGGATEGDTDTDTDGALVPGDEGCSCSTTSDERGGAPWSVLGLFGLWATLGRRRRRD